MLDIKTGNSEYASQMQQEYQQQNGLYPREYIVVATPEQTTEFKKTAAPFVYSEEIGVVTGWTNGQETLIENVTTKEP
jgi:hypothetical protein